jgi:membrane associated rhomboid family serine protease
MWEDIKQQFRGGRMASRLIIVNVAIYLVFELSLVLFHQFSNEGSGEWFLTYTAVTSNLGSLLVKPWTIISYQFVHQRFGHILYNMLMLYFGGRLFSEFLSDKKMLRVYLGAGIAGALMYVLAYNLLPAYAVEKQYSVAIGASASALGIFVAIATYVPNFMVSLFMLIEVRLKYVAIFLVVLDVINLDNGNAGGHFTHLGGALFGFLYARSLKQGSDWFDAILKPFVALKKTLMPRSRSLKKVYESATGHSGSSAFQRDKMKQEVIDRILDKISRSGYNSLSKEEKEILFHASKDKQ